MIDLALSVPEVATEPYEPRGIFPSEMALIIGICRDMGIQVVLESGRARAQSTYLLAKYLPNVTIHSVERYRDADAEFAEARLADFDNVRLWYGDGLSMVRDLVAMGRGERIAVLLDGPKGQPALDLLQRCIEWDPAHGLKVGFIHDMRKVDHDEPAPFRLAAEKLFPGAFFTDDEVFVRATKHLDEPVYKIGPASNWKPFFIGGEYLGSYGPTLGVFVMENR